jgi:2-phospho-L-lactate guanylyltransferase (CobY/MobA/RfbA family)
LTTLHRDIDTAADLWDAQRIGLGRHSLAVISTSTQQCGAEPSGPTPHRKKR